MLEIVELNAANAHLLDRSADIFDEPVDARRVAACVADSSHILIVAVSDGVVVGQCLGVIHQHPDKATDLYIEDLAVDVSMQRRGIATRLVAALLDCGKRHSVQALWVATEPENAVAGKFYASLGLASRPALVFELELPAPETRRAGEAEPSPAVRATF